MICPRFVARELTAPADGGARAWWTVEVPQALCPGRRGANDESPRGVDASDQWTPHLAAGQITCWQHGPKKKVGVGLDLRIAYREAWCPPEPRRGWDGEQTAAYGWQDARA